MSLDKSTIQALPKVLLHEHLDGSMRPQTIIELAKDAKYTKLPTADPTALANWFYQGAYRGDLTGYLEGFTHTIAVTQTAEALERVAYEEVEDLKNDGVVYLETRFAPIFHTKKGLTNMDVVSAVLKGLERGRKDFKVPTGLIICAMRNMKISLEMAELAVDFRDRGVVGFDLAGEEGGYPPKKHVDAFHYIQRQNFNITVHAGEGYGRESIWQAIQYCGCPLPWFFSCSTSFTVFAPLSPRSFCKSFSQQFPLSVEQSSTMISSCRLSGCRATCCKSLITVLRSL